MKRPFVFVMIVAVLMAGCKENAPPAPPAAQTAPAPTAAEIAKATADQQKSDATLARIKNITQMGETMLARHKEMYETGLISKWIPLSEQERAIPFMFALAGETDDDALLCLAAAIASEDTLTAVKTENVEGAPFKKIAEISKTSAVTLAKASQLTDDYANAKVIAKLLKRKP